MRVAVLPLNAAPGANTAHARQFMNFSADVLKSASDVQIDLVGYMAQVEEGGIPKVALVNPSESLNDVESIATLFQQSPAERAIDGLLTSEEITIRAFENGKPEPIATAKIAYNIGDIFAALGAIVEFMAKNCGVKTPKNENLFGTEDAAAFLNFLEGYDAAIYVERSQGQVVEAFGPGPALDALLSASKADPDWEAPTITLLHLVRLCVRYRVGGSAVLEAKLRQAVELWPDDARAHIVLGELLQAIAKGAQAADAYQKAHELEPDDPAILTRIGMAQMSAGMYANAERTLSKVIDVEGPDQPSLDSLATCLHQLGRGHEVPGLYAKAVERRPDQPELVAKYAVRLIADEKFEEAEKLLEDALETFDGSTIIKQTYAPYLAYKKQDYDAALDMYEDVLDAEPTDINKLLEYAQILEAAGRQVDLPETLNSILALNPDPSTRAATKGRLIELEQHERAEKVRAAGELADAGNFSDALDMLRPLRNWLSDYWKLWAVLANAYNKVGEPEEAETAARRLLEMYPRFEPGYVELSEALAKQDRTDEALALMRVAQGNMPSSLTLAVGLALATKRAGDEDEAKAMADRIRVATNNNEEVSKALAEIDGGDQSSRVIKLPFADD